RCDAEAFHYPDLPPALVSVVLLGNGGAFGNRPAAGASSFGIRNGGSDLLGRWWCAQWSWRMDQLSCAGIGRQSVDRNLSDLALSIADRGPGCVVAARAPYAHAVGRCGYRHSRSHPAVSRTSPENRTLTPGGYTFLPGYASPGKIQPFSVTSPMEFSPSCTENRTVVSSVSPGASESAWPSSIMD